MVMYTRSLQESRNGRNFQHQLVPLLRKSLYGRPAGYEDTRELHGADATLAKPGVCGCLEERRVLNASGLTSNAVLQWDIGSVS